MKYFKLEAWLSTISLPATFHLSPSLLCSPPLLPPLSRIDTCSRTAWVPRRHTAHLVLQALIYLPDKTTSAMNGFVQNLPRPPSKKERQAELEGRVLNPFKLFAMLSPMQHALFWSAWSVYQPATTYAIAYLL